MKTMLTFILSIGLLSAVNAQALDCSKLAGKWSLTEDSGESNVIEIKKTCEAQFIKWASRHNDEAIDADFVFKKEKQWRIQYRYKAGSRDESGTPFPYPLPSDVAKALQGNITFNQDGSISFGFDALDAMCAERGVECPSGHFFRVSSLTCGLVHSGDSATMDPASIRTSTIESGRAKLTLIYSNRYRYELTYDQATDVLSNHIQFLTTDVGLTSEVANFSKIKLGYDSPIYDPTTIGDIVHCNFVP